MAVLFCCTYRVDDPAVYARYNPGSLGVIGAVIARHGGRILAAGAPSSLDGDHRDVAAVVSFPDERSVHGYLDDPEYAEARALREGSTSALQAWVVPTLHG